MKKNGFTLLEFVVLGFTFIVFLLSVWAAGHLIIKYW